MDSGAGTVAIQAPAARTPQALTTSSITPPRIIIIIIIIIIIGRVEEMGGERGAFKAEDREGQCGSRANPRVQRERHYGLRP